MTTIFPPSLRWAFILRRNFASSSICSMTSFANTRSNSLLSSDGRGVTKDEISCRILFPVPFENRLANLDACDPCLLLKEPLGPDTPPRSDFEYPRPSPIFEKVLDGSLCCSDLYFAVEVVVAREIKLKRLYRVLGILEGFFAHGADYRYSFCM